MDQEGQGGPVDQEGPGEPPEDQEDQAGLEDQEGLGGQQEDQAGPEDQEGQAGQEGQQAQPWHATHSVQQRAAACSSVQKACSRAVASVTCAALSIGDAPLLGLGVAP